MNAQLTPDPQNDLHIVSTAIYSVLTTIDLISAVSFRQLYCEPKDQSVAAQIIHANRFWRSQIAHLDSDAARTARMALQDNIGLQDWICAFGRVVGPLVAENELPSSYRGRGIADNFDVDQICESLQSHCFPQQLTV